MDVIFHLLALSLGIAGERHFREGPGWGLIARPLVGLFGFSKYQDSLC